MKNFNMIKKEYEDFRKKVLLLSKEEIYDKAFTINFYEHIYNYLEFGDYKIPEKMTIIGLFEFYNKMEYLHYNTEENIEEMLRGYKIYLKRAK